MLRDNLRVKFIELHEIRPPQSKVFEKLISLELFSHHEQGLRFCFLSQNNPSSLGISLAEDLGLAVSDGGCFFECFFHQLNRNRPALQRIVLVFFSDRHHNDALIDPIVENRLDLFIYRLIQENGAMRFLIEDGAPAVLEKGDNELSVFFRVVSIYVRLV